MDEIYRVGLEIVRQVQAACAPFDTPMQFFTMLGQSDFYFALLPLIFWCVSKEVGANLTMLLLTSSYFNGMFKGTFQGPRPYWLDASLEKATSDSFGFPSGHAQAVATVWGYLALRVRRWWGWVIALFVIVMISLSRVYLGEHFPTDVLAGALVGGLLIVLFVAFQPRLGKWFANKSLAAQVGWTIAATTVALLGITAIVGSDRAWYTFSLYLSGLSSARESMATASGALMGAGIGLILERRYVKFSPEGLLWQRLARGVIGMVGVWVLWFQSDLIIPAEPLAVGLTLEFLRYAVTTFWVTFVWPWLFVRFKWATKKRLNLTLPAEKKPGESEKDEHSTKGTIPTNA